MAWRSVFLFKKRFETVFKTVLVLFQYSFIHHVPRVPEEHPKNKLNSVPSSRVLYWSCHSDSLSSEECDRGKVVSRGFAFSPNQWQFKGEANKSELNLSLHAAAEGLSPPRWSTVDTGVWSCSRLFRKSSEKAWKRVWKDLVTRKTSAKKQTVAAVVAAAVSAFVVIFAAAGRWRQWTAGFCSSNSLSWNSPGTLLL